MTPSNQWDVIVVGGGPAGLMAAGRCGELGAKVLLLEKNPNLGRKLILSGGGRCNLTNAEHDVRTLAGHYGAAQQALLSPLTKFSAVSALDWFESRGLPTKVEALQRAFPADDRSESVLQALVAYAREKSVTIETRQRVEGILSTREPQPRVTGVETSRGPLAAGHVILAVGGTSRPETGSTGDGFEWLRALGLRVRIPEPSLVPIAVKEPWIQQLAGLSLPDAAVEARVGNRVLERRRGKLLFTHFGLSGPLVLNFASALSRWRSQTSREGELTLAIDTAPDISAVDLDRQWLEQFRELGSRKLRNALGGWPPRLVAPILSQAAIDPSTVVSQLTKEERRRLTDAVKGFRVTFRRLMDESRAVVSSGGLSIDELDFRTMTVKAFPNLSVIGDLIDINRPSGGFSLQLCWSTGWVAGSYAGKTRAAVVPLPSSDRSSTRP